MKNEQITEIRSRFLVDLLNRSYYMSSEKYLTVGFFFLKLGNKNAIQKEFKCLKQKKKPKITLIL